MLEINVKTARSKLSALLERVERGEEIIITRRGKKIARLVAIESGKMLPSLKDFRKTLSVSGKSLSNMVIGGRNRERY